MSSGTNERERDFFNRAYADGRRQAVRKYYSVTSASRQCFEDLLAPFGEGTRVLEYGCGPGSSAFELARRGAEVTGIDISDVAIEQARRHAEAAGLGSATFRVMDAQALDFADDSFDLVCGTGILHHLSLEQAFPELARTLKPGGLAVFAEPLGHNPLLRLYRALTPRMRSDDEHPLLQADLDLAKRWFDDVDAQPFHLASLLAVPLRRLPGFGAVVRALARFDATLFRIVPGLGRHAWQVVLALRGPKSSSSAAG